MGMPLSWTERPSSMFPVYDIVHTMQEGVGRLDVAILEEEAGIELNLDVAAVQAQPGGDIFAAPRIHFDDFGGEAQPVQARPGKRSGGGVAVFRPDVVRGADSAGLEQVFAKADPPIFHVVAA